LEIHHRSQRQVLHRFTEIRSRESHPFPPRVGEVVTMPTPPSNMPILPVKQAQGLALLPVKGRKKNDQPAVLRKIKAAPLPDA
jgi:hypothetical protein